MTHPIRPPSVLAALVLLSISGTALAQEAEPTPPPAENARPGDPPRASRPPELADAGRVDLNFPEVDLMGLLEYFARATGRNFVLGDKRELEGKKVTIIANRDVTPAAAWEAFMSALEVHGLTIVEVGGTYKVIKAGDAQTSPGRPGEGGVIRATDQYITQIIPFENVSVKDVREIVDNLVSPNAKVLAYAPSNTLILTDTGHNIRRIYNIINKLDIEAPKSSMEIYPIVFADAAEVKNLIEELYGTAEETEQDDNPRSRRRRSRRSSRSTDDGEGVTAGEESTFIQKVLSDERTNSLIILADERGHEAIRGLIERIDIDVDPTSRSQIYVYRLEHAKAEDVIGVLQDLSQEGGRGGGRSGRGQGNQDQVDSRLAAARARQSESRETPEGAETGGAIAAFDSGMRIAADENTNSLVIIASRDDYEVISTVIRELDVKRKQVFVDTVVLEMSSTDSFDFKLAYHTPFTAGNNAQGIVGGQFGTNSLGLSPDSLNGFSFGVYGQSVDIPVTGPDGGVTTLAIPAFGIALQALKTNQMVNIVSTPSILALDNEEAEIVVGRKIPFPTSNGLNSLGQPVVTFQREDVAVTLKVTPRINSENLVTLELEVEVEEVEDSDAIDPNQAGFITSQRSVKTTALVGDNETAVLGGLVGSTDSESESKIPVLGDLPIIGALFRSRSTSTRRTNLMVFLTPHIIDDSEDMEEVMRVKEAQRQEFMRRFYGKSQDEQFAEIQRLLQFSMNAVDQPSVYRGPATITSTVTLDGQPISAAARDEVEGALEVSRSSVPGNGAGTLPPSRLKVEGGEEEPPEAGEEARESGAGLAQPSAVETAAEDDVVPTEDEPLPSADELLDEVDETDAAGGE